MFPPDFSIGMGLAAAQSPLAALQAELDRQRQAGQALYQNNPYQGASQASGLQQGFFERHALAQLNQKPLMDYFKPKPAAAGERKVGMIREYINKHKDILLTLVVAIVADHLILDGALRTRIQRVIEAALTRIEKALGLPAEEKVVSEP